MPQIRANAAIGDLIVRIAGLGAAGLCRIHPQLIYWMRVDETPIRLIGSSRRYFRL